MTIQPQSEVMGRRSVDRWRKSLSNWGRWGHDDTAGTVNVITDDVRRLACALVRSGHAVSCGRPLETGPDGDDISRPLHLMVRSYSADARSDFIALAPHGYGVTHIDALGHFTYRGRGYNGRESQDGALAPTTALGVDALKHGIVGRGVLLDIPRNVGQPYIEPGEGVSVEVLEAAAAAENVELRAGDILLVRTGRWRRRLVSGPWDVSASLAGLDPSCLPWLHSKKFAILGSDGVNDVLPSRVEGVRLPIHEVALVSIGLHLLDNLDLESVADACASYERWDFLLTVAPLIIPHGTSSPVNPIAVF